VIATDNGSIPDMIRCNGREAGQIVPLLPSRSLDQVALEAAMRRYMTDAELLQAHQRQTDYVFDQLFDAAQVAERYMKFFQQAVPSLGSSAQSSLN
jgi:glycosyltransferase involved in cell wall biosynthesis